MLQAQAGLSFHEDIHMVLTFHEIEAEESVWKPVVGRARSISVLQG